MLIITIISSFIDLAVRLNKAYNPPADHELLQNWKLAKNNQATRKIEPLQ